MAGVCLDIPSGVSYGSMIEGRRVVAKLEVTNRVRLLQSEHARYFYTYTHVHTPTHIHIH